MLFDNGRICSILLFKKKLALDPPLKCITTSTDLSKTSLLILVVDTRRCDRVVANEI